MIASLAPLLTSLSLSLATPSPVPPPVPAIDIRSETLTVKHREKQATFGGGVVAVRGDLTMRCPSVVADYDDSSQVRTVTCDGPITALQGPRTMAAGSGIFDNAAGVLTLSGEPTLVEGARTITGETIVYDLVARQAQVTSGRAELPAADAKTLRGAGQGPLRVQADRIRYDSDRRIATFTGGVTARRGDLTLRASRLVTTYDETGTLQRAWTDGGPVVVDQRERHAKAGRASFARGASRLVLEGEPIVTEAGSTLTGDRVTFLLGADRVEVERPKAIFPLGQGSKEAR